MVARRIHLGGTERTLFGAIVLSTVIAFAGAAAPPTNATIIDKAAPAASTIVVAQRCRRVQRRQNGACKMRVCRDRW